MKKTLYISDLDGTLLGNNSFLSPFTVRTLNQLIKDGAYFSIATARNLPSSTPRIQDIKFQIPIILNNGAIMYNWQEKYYHYTAKLDSQDIDTLGTILHEMQCTGYMYALKNEEIYMIHNPIFSPEDKAYFKKRRPRYEGHILEPEYLTAMESGFAPFYCMIFGPGKKVKPIQERINTETFHMHGVLNSSVYEQDSYFLDVFHSSVSKASTIQMLADQLNVDEIVAFGDNYNDLEMLKAADRSYAPSNALPEIKETVDGILDSCENDGVAKFIYQDFYKNFSSCES